MIERTHASGGRSRPGNRRATAGFSGQAAPLALLGIALASLCLAAGGCASLRNPQAVLENLGPRETLPPAWLVSGGHGADLYILGSIHLGPARGWEYPPGILAALDQASAVVVEVNVKDVDDVTLERLVAHFGYLAPGRSLRRNVSPSTWALLEARLAQSSIPLAAVSRLQPWLLSNLIVVEAIRRGNYFPDRGTEDDFIRRAGSRSVVPLETPADQLSFLGALPRRTQELYLVDTLTHYDAAGHFVGRYVDAWRSGDAKTLGDLIFDSYRRDKSFAPFFDAVIFDRSDRMGKQLKVLLEANQHAGELVFVVLGVAHMLGDASIADDLAAQGYRVDRIPRSELRTPRRPGENLAVHP